MLEAHFSQQAHQQQPNAPVSDSHQSGRCVDSLKRVKDVLDDSRAEELKNVGNIEKRAFECPLDLTPSNHPHLSGSQVFTVRHYPSIYKC